MPLPNMQRTVANALEPRATVRARRRDDRSSGGGATGAACGRPGGQSPGSAVIRSNSCPSPSTVAGRTGSPRGGGRRRVDGHVPPRRLGGCSGSAGSCCRSARLRGAAARTQERARKRSELSRAPARPASASGPPRRRAGALRDRGAQRAERLPEFRIDCGQLRRRPVGSGSSAVRSPGVGPLQKRFRAVA